MRRRDFIKVIPAVAALSTAETMVIAAPATGEGWGLNRHTVWLPRPDSTNTFHRLILRVPSRSLRNQPSSLHLQTASTAPTADQFRVSFWLRALPPRAAASYQRFCPKTGHAPRRRGRPLHSLSRPKALPDQAASAAPQKLKRR